MLIAFLQPLTDAEGIERLAGRGVVAFAMESIPRITRAQSMDALSSQSTVAGYKAALLAADRLPRFFPMLMTAAGTVAAREGARARRGRRRPAGDRDGASGSARSCRASTCGRSCASRSRASARRSSTSACVGEETEGGYARELTPEQQAQQQQALEERIPDFDAVITTALDPRPPRAAPDPGGRGRAACAPGSVIVDLAAETGGNCELTRARARSSSTTASRSSGR